MYGPGITAATRLSAPRPRIDPGAGPGRGADAGEPGSTRIAMSGPLSLAELSELPPGELDSIRAAAGAISLPRERSVVVLRHDDVIDALANQRLGVRHRFRTTIRLYGGPTVVDTDGPDHRRQRKPVVTGLMESLEAFAAGGGIDEIATGAVADLRKLPVPELVDSLAVRVVTEVMAIMTGLSPEEALRLHMLHRPIVGFLAGDGSAFAAARANLADALDLYAHRNPTVEMPDAHLTRALERAVLDGARIAVRRHGHPDGPRLVLSHGNGISIDAYYPFWSCFADRFDLFIHDVRNHGWNSVGNREAHNFPNFVSDADCVVRAIDRRFGRKPRAGIFHSLSSLVALHQCAGHEGFAALVLFDPPVCPPGGFPSDMVDVGRRLGLLARRRRDRFRSPAEFVEHLSGMNAFERVSPNSLDLFARTTLRRTGSGYRLCCPREYEAQICQYFFCWSMTVEFGQIACPVKVIGADPTVANSYMPGMDIRELLLTDYDFVPDTSHFLQIEKPDTCAALTLEFLARCGFA